MQKTLLSLTLASLLYSQETYELESISIIGTKSEEPSAKISQSVAVVDEKVLENRNITNINDAIQGIPGVFAESKNGGYDSRLIIRGAGLKAPYGVREIMVLRDGVPMTDPDSFTRFDFIDVDDLERVEILKGPGSLEGSGSAGGVISLKSRSVFDNKSSARIGFGNYNAQNHHLRVQEDLSETDSLSVTASYRQSDNDWRRHNTFSTIQTSLKYGHVFEDDSVLEAEVSYTKADLKFAGSMNEEQFETFKDTGEQKETQDAWKHTGRFSDIFFANLRYEKETAAFTYKPVFFYNLWSHFHPVTGAINDKSSYVLGTDQKIQAPHAFAGINGEFVGGVAIRTDRSLHNEKYEYRNVTTVPNGPSAGRITATLSDAKGALMEEGDDINDIYGLYLSEQLYLSDALLLNINGRYDRSHFDISGTEYRAYDYAAGKYVDGVGAYAQTKDYDLFSAKIGMTYELNQNLNFYALTALSDQVPTSSEFLENPDLKASRSINYEMGLKARSDVLFMDLALYQNYVKDEVVTQIVNDYRVYANAGQTNKKGAEATVKYQVISNFFLAGSYSYNDYTYDDYVDNGVDYSGKQLKYIPKHQYSISASYSDPKSLSVSVDSQTWGKYYTNDLNTDEYDGYSFVTNMMVAYTIDAFQIRANIKNVFDQRYATEVKTGTSKYEKDYYTAAAPRTFLLSARYSF